SFIICFPASATTVISPLSLHDALPIFLAVEAHRHQLLLHAAAGQVQHPGAVVVELRRLAGLGHPHRLAAGRGNDVDAALVGPQAAGQAAAAAAAVHHVAPVRGEARVVVEARLIGDLAAHAGAAGPAHVDRAHAL